MNNDFLFFLIFGGGAAGKGLLGHLITIALEIHLFYLQVKDS